MTNTHPCSDCGHQMWATDHAVAPLACSNWLCARSHVPLTIHRDGQPPEALVVQVRGPTPWPPTGAGEGPE